MRIPDDLHYTAEHEWVALSGDLATVGITDFAQDALGDVVYVGVPDVGTTVDAGSVMGEVESTKSVSEIYAPVSGAVVEVNAALADRPELLNEDPYGEGWICRLRCADGSGDALLDAAAYRALTEA